MRQEVEQFLLYLSAEKNVSPHTLAAYRTDLRQFLGWWGNAPINQVGHRDIRAFMGELHEKGLKASSRSRKLASLRSLFKFLIRESILTKNPAKLVSSPKCPRRIPRFLTVKQVEALLVLPDLRTLKGVRDRAIQELLYASALRVHELTELDVESLSMESGLIRVMGKGRKEHLVPFGKEAARALAFY